MKKGKMEWMDGKGESCVCVVCVVCERTNEQTRGEKWMN